MSDLKSPKLIYLKGWLFLLILLVSIALLLLQSSSWSNVFLILLLIWSSARFYYFIFYVIENYVDSTYKFDGIISFIRYLIRERKNKDE